MGCVFNTAMEKDQPYPFTQRRQKLTTIDCRRRSTRVIDILQNVTMISEQLNNAQINFCIENLRNHQLFSYLNEEELRSICQQMVWMEANKQQYIFKQGETGHSFFLIEKGRVSVQIDGKKAIEMKLGQCFGELALLFKASRAASIKCLESTNRFFVMKPGLYRSILQKLKTVEYTHNMGVIQKISLFQSLTNKQKFSLANSIKIAKFKEGETIFEAGQVSQGLYIISQGAVQIVLQGMLPITLGHLQIFGQNSLRDDERRLGHAKCLLDSTCLIVGKKDLYKILGPNAKSLIYYNMQKWALLRSKVFDSFSSAEFNNIVMGFEIIQIEANKTLLSSVYRGLVIALEGGINNLPDGTLFNIDKWKAGDQQGQQLIKDKSGLISYLSFEKLNDIIRQIQDKQKLFRASQRCIPEVDNNLSLNDFQVVKKLGEGQFGQVFLIKNKKTCGGLYAVKCISKKAVRQEQMQLSVIEEKKILEKAVFPFIVGFVKAFHDDANIFLLMEYLRGKQMFEVIREMPNLPKPIARYYFGCLMLSIEYLHANNIIYRDIKPQNSVVDHQGKVHLIDLGTAKELVQQKMFKTFTIIGTPHYMAPEVFEGKGYSFEADYWSLGVILYEFICGRLPFGENINTDPYALYALIKRGRVEYPKFMTDEKAKRLIQYLLVRDPKIRSQQVAFDTIKRHQYFSAFNWDDLLEDKMYPPYIPQAFRLKTVESNQTTAVPFLKQLYNGNKFGNIEEWDQNIGFSSH